ncbi:MAG TPA: TonB-dependent receptor [Candidatus Acidoferrales bacterium]|nr:TonB-dependent receptor [Candidatus Acidoferrales bacterium]
MRTILGRSVVAFGFLFFAFCTSASAQLFPGRVTGTVRDSQGAAVPGATLKLTNVSTGQDRSAVSGANGDFNFPGLPLGTFQLVATKTGFQTTVVRDIVTSQGQVNNVDPVLAVGSISSQVAVTSAPPLIQTETDSSGGQLSEQQVQALPIGNSDYTRLALVLPGVTQNSNFAFAQYTINGSRSRSNGFNIDGASDTDPSTYLPSINEGGNSATAATRLPLDAIQEVAVSANAGADSGQNSGSVMNVTIRSGTNQLHGAAYELHRDASLDAANFFENLGGVSKAPFVWNEFGGTIGGPVVIPHIYDGHDKTFFFAGFDGSRLHLGTTLHGNAPTSAQIAQATAMVQSQGLQPNQLGLNITGIYSSLGLSGPFVVDNRGQQSPNSGVLKIDHKISDADSLSARYLHGEGEDEFPGGGPGPGGGSQLSPWFGVTPTVADNFAISEVHIVSPALINTLRLGWNRFDQFQKGRDADVNPATIGFNTGVGPSSYGIPEIDIGDTAPDGFSNLGLQYGAGGRVATSYQISDDLYWTHGAHAWKFGFNLLHNYVDYTTAGSRGIFSFTGSQLGDQLTPDPGLAALVDLVAGLPTPGPNLTAISRVGSPRTNIDQNIISGFGMDTFKINSRLTLNAGLRYDFFTTVNESRGRFSVFDPTAGLIEASKLSGGHIYSAPKGDLGPRVSIAWAPPITVIPGRQTVIRAGFGIYYDTIPLNNFEEGLAQNPIGPTGGYTVVPSAPIPFGVGVPIFGTGAPQPPFNIESVQRNLKTPNTQEWNFNIQQELSRQVVFQVGYVGNHSIHQLQLLDINQPPLGAGYGPGCANPPDPVCEQDARPFNAKFPALSQINTISSAGFATYNSLQAVLRSNDFHGLTTQIAFTWSHNLDTASEVEDFYGTSGYVPQDSANLKSDYGNSEFDQRRALLITYVYAIPSPKSGGLLERAGKNWQVSGTTTLRDGLAAPLLTFGDESGVGNFHERYNCIAPIHYQLKDFTQPYASVSSFSDPLPGTFGNCPRDPLVAPGLNSWDISLQRTFKFSDRLGFEFRTSFFNAFNHPNFAEPAPDLSTIISATADDGSFDSHFGVGGPRNIQFMGKFTF